MRSHFTGRRAITALIVAGIAVVMALPSVALAASATFSLKKPTPSSSSTVTKPKLSVYVVDRYGIKGSTNFTLTLDGKAVKPKITYKRSGDYKRVTVSFQVATTLTVGPHTVYVRVKNIRKQTSSTSWKFTVTAPPVPVPGPMPVSIAATDCGACHVGYPTTHPMTECASCHGEGRPAGEPAYGPSDVSAHTLSCSLESPCHGGGGAFPHVLGSDCAQCHSAAFPDIPQGHAVEAEAAHRSTSARCTTTGCHMPSLTVEHYRRSIAGVRLSCATCHGSLDARVVAAIKSGSTACESCHTLTSAHVASAKSHVLATAPSCIGAACHSGGTNVALIHAQHGCSACHGEGRTPTIVCATCHVTDGHPPHTASPAPAAMTVNGTSFGVHACSECHAEADLRVIHGGSTSCGKCHPAAVASADPWLGGCVQGACHASGTFKMHATIDASHVTTATAACTVSGCHAGGTSAAIIHASAGGCPTCHEAGRTPTLVCATSGCHPTGAPLSHNGHTSKVTSAIISIGGRDYGQHACTECHATTELQAVHGGKTGCASCHPAPRNTFTEWNGGCVQGGCHATGALAMHGGATSAHVAATAPSCTAPGCHAGGSDAAAIHASGPGCPACHGVGKTPTLVCSASGCHSSAGTAAHNSHPATITSGTISINGTSYGKHLCSECHATTELQAVHGGASECRTCHPAPASSITTWNRGCVQGDCHKTGTATAMHGNADGAHTTATAPACTVAGCHAGGRDVAVIHATAGGCATCHGAGKAATLVCASAGCHPDGPPASHDAHPSTVTSGTLTVLGTSYGKHLCSECHPAMELQVLHGGASSCATCHPSPRSSFATWSGGCVQGGCHVSTSSTRMHGTINTGHTAPTGSCVTSSCHASNVAALHASGPGCAACHTGGAEPTLTCGACHTGDPHPAHGANVTAMTIVIGGTTFGSHACSECHSSSDLRDLHGGNTGCSTCHPAPRSTFTTWNKTCVQGGCHAPASSASLHRAIDTSHMAPAGACVSAGCHASNLATVHAAGPGCPACHGAGKTATLTCAASGCHDGGAPAGHAGHPATIAPVTITINGVGYGSRACTECHASTELQVLHGGATGCATCHPSPRSTFTTWNKTCVQADCHKAGSSLSMHGTLNASHTLVTAPTCTVAGCHSGASDVAAIHAAVTGRTDSGCGICHTVGKAATRSCSATGCHPTGQSARHASHPAAITSGTISINGTSYGKHTCAECHASTELQAAHGGTSSCSKCHPSPRDTFTKWGGTCAQGGCHTGGTPLAMHGSIDGAHSAAGAASCTVAGCHTGGDVAALHAPKGGCPICHAVGMTPTLVCSTPACHPTGAPSSHDAHPSIVTSGTIFINGASYGKHACSECHGAAELQTLHGGDDSCAKCHPSPRDTLATWSGGCVQGGCHPSTSPLKMHGTINTAHSTLTGPSCTIPGCHLGGGDVAKIHAAKGGCPACHAPGVTPSLVCADCHASDLTQVHAPFIGTSHDIALGGCVTTTCHPSADAGLLHAGGPGCVACHNATTTATLTCATCHPGDVTAVHTPYIGTRHAVTGGQCTNSTCHTSADAGLLHAGGPGCSACHEVGVTATLACSTCHTADLVTLHPVEGTAHTPSVHPCTGSCHGDNVAAIHRTSQRTCSVCHEGGEADTNYCLASTCHPYPGSSEHAGYAAVSEYHRGKSGTGWTDWGWKSNGTILAPYSRGASLPCSACHDAAGTMNLYNFPDVVNGTPVRVTSGPELINLCVACHGGTLNDWHQGCFDCHTNMAGPEAPRSMPSGTDCSPCHQHGSHGWPHGIGWMTGWPTM